MQPEVKVEISQAAYADIARRAVIEVDGVVGTARDPLFGIFGRFRKGYKAGGVKVKPGRKGVELTVSVVLAHGRDIWETLSAARTRIAGRIEDMTGTPAEVEITVKAVS
ncbi:MAG: Asp23/Gls24 family envelope stress response protein [Planctomycetes bacterium]|nr:Asp23/Gls24 family envelope stress response protein [Planctomycetota bacterium]